MPRKVKLLFFGVLAVAGLSALAPPARAGWAVGVRVGFPGPYYCGPRYYYGYRPYPLVVGVGVGVVPAPVVVAAPAPVIVQPVQPVYAAPVAAAAPAPAPAASASLPPAPLPVNVSHSPGTPGIPGGDADRYLRQLQNADPRERSEAAVQLGRLRDPQTVATLAATLNNDRSPAVRDAAARGLGLIGSPDALNALQKAAQSDDDRDVRRSASYAADVIRASLARPQ
jgi:hypothetical protein